MFSQKNQGPFAIFPFFEAPMGTMYQSVRKYAFQLEQIVSTKFPGAYRRPPKPSPIFRCSAGASSQHAAISGWLEPCDMVWK